MRFVELLTRYRHATKTPQQWCDIFGMKILDPDGWRKDGKPFDEPLSMNEFLDRFFASTTMSKNEYNHEYDT